jgi:FkbH-like protein
VETRYRLNRNLQILDFEEVSVVANGFVLQRSVLDRKLADLLRRFEGEGLRPSEFTSRSPIASQLFDYFKSREFIVPEDEDEQTRVRAALKIDSLAEREGNGLEFKTQSERYRMMAPVSAASFSGIRGNLKPLKVAIVGGCVVSVLKDRLEEAGLRHGLNIHAVVDVPDGTHAFDRVAEGSPDVIVYQPAVAHFLGPLWTNAAFITPHERRERLKHLKGGLTLYIEKLKSLVQGRLGLVHNIYPPSYSPFGRSSFRIESNFREMVSELNLHIESLIRGSPNLFLVDEEQLVARIGARNLVDEAWFLLEHHGGLPDLRRAEFEQLPAFGQAFAEEYIACYLAWSGSRKIKCIVCDLDGTLWPGVQAETGMEWATRQSNTTYLHLGVHEALRLMRRRGVCLVTVSKNDLEPTLAAWREASERNPALLSPDDFVAHRIDWKPKSVNIRELADALELGLDSILVIDDNPVEREQIARALPGVRLLGEDMTQVREALLTDPALDLNLWTEESMNRPVMVQAQLAREQERASAPDESEFLRSLKIEMTLRAGVSEKHLGRLVELIQRTNQFNTTLVRYDAGTLATFGPRVHSMSVKDRFCDYGLVGAIVLDASSVSLMVMSCRVIGLSVAVPFLVSALRASRLPLDGFRGTIVTGPRNSPCRDLFLQAGFRDAGGGEFVLEKASDLAAVDPGIYRIISAAE